jgi:hypothetical protein
MFIDPAKMAVLSSFEPPDNGLVAGSHFSSSNPFIVITGFNTDIEHGGVVYHVQTEDKGLDSPLILSLVYSGGAILASKRSRYEDLIEAGFDEEVLIKRLQRQHRLICAAINAGRLEELKRMGARAEPEAPAAPSQVAAVAPGDGEMLPAAEPESAEVTAEILIGASQFESVPVVADVTEDILLGAARFEGVPEVPVPVASEAESEPADTEAEAEFASEESTYTVHDPRRESPLGEPSSTDTGLALTVLDDDEFLAGESFTIRVLVQNRTARREKPLPGITVSVKILGTTFRPQLYSVKTESDGVASVAAVMPVFTSGRAAVLIRVVAKGETAELRRILHPAQ